MATSYRFAIFRELCIYRSKTGACLLQDINAIKYLISRRNVEDRISKINYQLESRSSKINIVSLLFLSLARRVLKYDQIYI